MNGPSDMPGGTSGGFGWVGKLACILSVAGIGWLLLMGLMLAANLELEYYDGFDYLANASAIRDGGAGPVTYRPTRPPLIPLGQALALSIPFRAQDPVTRLLQVPHVFSAFLSALALWAFFVFLRAALRSGPLALFTVFLISLNRLVVHYFPFVMSDLTAAMLSSLGLYFFIRAEEGGGRAAAWSVLSGVCFAGAVLTRFAFILVLVPLSLDWMVRKVHWPSASRSPLVTVAVAIVLPLVFMIVLQRALFGPEAGSLLAVVGSLHDASQALWTQTGVRDQAVEYPMALIKAAGLPVVLLMIAGMVMACRSRSRISDLMLVWVLSFAVLTLLAKHKEPRYLTPLLPGLYYFAAVAIRGIGRWVEGWMRGDASRATAYGVAGLLLLTASAAVPAAAEYLHFRDPVYSEPFTRAVTREILRRAGAEGRVLWYPGHARYSIRPEREVFVRGDDCFYYYQLGARPLSYLTHREVVAIPYAGRYDPSLPAVPNLLQAANAGDVLVVSLENERHSSEIPPPAREPLFVGTVTVREFLPKARPASRSKAVALREETTGATLRWSRDGGGATLESSTNLMGELYLVNSGGRTNAPLMVELDPGEPIRIDARAHPEWMAAPDRLILVWMDYVELSPYGKSLVH